MALSPNHGLVWSGLGKVARDHVGSRSALQHELQTAPVQRSPGTPQWALQELSPAGMSPGLWELWVRHISWSVRAVGQACLLVCGSCGSGATPTLHVLHVPGSRSRLVVTPCSSTLGERRGQGSAPRAMLSLQQFYV